MYDEETTAYEKCLDELKRIDHQIFVSLKYTRTVDVIRNIIERMLNAFDFIFVELLERAERSGQIFEVPVAPALRTNALKKLYEGNKELLAYIDFYLLLRQLKNAEYTAHQEFRRYVTMTAKLPNGKDYKVDIDSITEQYNKMKEFAKFAKELLAA